HRNEPGVLSEINGYISEAKANIQAQYLSTDSKIGYLVVDLEMDKAIGSEYDLVEKIQKSERSIKTRLVF
ncbi:MAG: phosphoglycerate dehydrogenase, partial [Moraxellaceae bacterium]|nr:phosphoglycerate dehydrogenase [Pseudobdellovibrionaceae bacterium]